MLAVVFPPWISKVMRVVFGISFFFDQESVDYFGNIVDQIMEERGSSSEVSCTYIASTSLQELILLWSQGFWDPN